MAKAQKRPSKAAKAAKRILADSKLLAQKKDGEAHANASVEKTISTPRTSSGIKPRPDKKRG